MHFNSHGCSKTPCRQTETSSVLAAKGADCSKIVTNGCCCHPGFAHGIADLVKPEHDVAGCIQALDAGALMSVNTNAIILAQIGAKLPRQIGLHCRPKCRIDRIKALTPLSSSKADRLRIDPEIRRWPIDEGYPGIGERRLLLGVQLVGVSPARPA